jgi:drug/metabolite transporter (DMT)-like permease
MQILMNKAILSVWDFTFPYFLTGWHMLFATVLTQLLRYLFPSLLPGVKENKVSIRVYLTKILPISLCFALSLTFGNKAYIYLSVSFIQMLKAFTPVSVLLLSFIGGLEAPSFVQLLIVSFICLGVTLSTVGELRFSTLGFLLQVSGTNHSYCSTPFRATAYKISNFLFDKLLITVVWRHICGISSSCTRR